MAQHRKEAWSPKSDQSLWLACPPQEASGLSLAKEAPSVLTEVSPNLHLESMACTMEAIGQHLGRTAKEHTSLGDVAPADLQVLDMIALQVESEISAAQARARWERAVEDAAAWKAHQLNLLWQLGPAAARQALEIASVDAAALAAAWLFVKDQHGQAKPYLPGTKKGSSGQLWWVASGDQKQDLANHRAALEDPSVQVLLELLGETPGAVSDKQTAVLAGLDPKTVPCVLDAIKEHVSMAGAEASQARSGAPKQQLPIQRLFEIAAQVAAEVEYTRTAQLDGGQNSADEAAMIAWEKEVSAASAWQTRQPAEFGKTLMPTTLAAAAFGGSTKVGDAPEVARDSKAWRELIVTGA